MSETLATFLNADDPARARRNATALQRASALTRSNGVASALRGAAADAIAETARGMLDSPLYDVFSAGWSKLDALRKFRDPNAYPPDKINEFVLHSHEIALKRTPSMELVLNGAPTGVQLECELKIALKIASAVLKIQNARIIGASVGKVNGEGAFSCIEVTLAERKTSTVKLPGQMAFAPGVAIV